MPPRWKTAVVIWLAIYPSITLLLWLAGPRIGGWALPVRTLVVTAVLVPWMVFVVLPALQRVLAPWLRPAPPEERRELIDPEPATHRHSGVRAG
jgi:antibiotic biosynthesis monooxygenase (ABM) superfamily enzyme